VIIAAQAWRDDAEKDKPWKDIWDSGHYMVVIGLDKKNVYFEDPSILQSRGFMPREEFLERWHDVDYNVPCNHLGIFVHGDGPKPFPPVVHVD
jgi:predicted double-glycine peptidase